MEFTGSLFQIFIIIIITILTLLYICCRSLTFSSAASSPSAAADDDHDDTDILPPPPREKYDVFISFRGEDTRRGITSHLHAALLQKKIETYIDYRLVRGYEVGPALLEAIEKSTLSVIIFSKNYADSTWCLDELVHILECKAKYGQMVVLPIFYDISPSDVRKQQGSYAAAFAKIEKRFKDRMDKLHKWRAALTDAANLSGFDNSDKKRTEADLVKEVVDDIWSKLKRETSYDLKGLVGIRSHIDKIESLLCINDSQKVCTVGIWGMGGIGKTTLAVVVFHRLSSEFDACCLLKNVTEKSGKPGGRDDLENTLLTVILKERDLSIGSDIVRKSLSRTKVLIVFDDVSDSRQIEHLTGDYIQYGPGSRIIITSRERSVLEEIVEDDKNIYKVEGLKPADALQLFHLHAFRKKSPTADYTDLSARALDYAGGIPLALKILGSLLHPCKNKEQWQDVLNKLKKYPNKEIQNVLRVSYDRLEENEQEVFLDIACFHKWGAMDDVKRQLDVSGFYGADGIRVLIDKSLISIDSELEIIEMHDLVQETAWAIVREQCIQEPGKRSRLFIAQDVKHVLTNNSGTESVQAIFFNVSEIGDLPLDVADFKRMYNLRWLSFPKFGTECKLNVSLPSSLRYLYWPKYPWKSLPTEFSGENLVELHMRGSQLEQLWNEGQNFKNLEVIDLRGSRNLTIITSLSRSLFKLTHLDLTDSNVKYLPEMPGNFQILNLRGTGIKKLPSSVLSKDLKRLDLGCCSEFEYFPEILEPMEHLEFLSLEETAVEKLPSSIGNLIGLQFLDVSDCENLDFVPQSIYGLNRLKTLRLRLCSELKKLPPFSIGLHSLEELKLGYSGISKIPRGLICITSLRDLDLRGTKIKSVPASIKHVSQLSRLWLTNCKRLQSLPELPLLSCLEADGCTSLKTVSSSRTAIVQGWDKYELFRGKLTFSNCLNLDQNAWSNIMADARHRIMRVATASSNFREEKLSENSDRNSVSILCPGNEIPEWFSNQNEGSSINIKLPPDWFGTHFLGFALSLLVTFNPRWVQWGFKFGCKYNFKTNHGETHEIKCTYHLPMVDPAEWYEYTNTSDSDHVFVFYNAFELVEGAKWSTAFYKLVTEASVEFYRLDYSVDRLVDYSSPKVKKCGICLLYAQDAEKLKSDIMIGEPKGEEDIGQDESDESGSEESESS